MNIKLTEKETLALYRIILRWDNTNLGSTQDEEERQLLWDLHCVLEKELEPAEDAVTHRLV